MNCDRFKCVVDGRLLSDSDGGEPKMHVLIANPPWPGPGYGARSDVRWPHKRSDKYIEYPIYLSYTVAVVEEAGFEVSFIDAIMDELGIEEGA